MRAGKCEKNTIKIAGTINGECNRNDGGKYGANKQNSNVTTTSTTTKTTTTTTIKLLLSTTTTTTKIAT